MILDFEIKQDIIKYKLLYEDHYTFSVLTFMKEMSDIFVYKLLYKKAKINISERNYYLKTNFI